MASPSLGLGLEDLVSALASWPSLTSLLHRRRSVLAQCFCSSSTVYFILLCSADVECGSLLEVDRHLAPGYQAGKKKKSPTVPATF